MKLPPNYGQDYTKKFESLFKEIAKKEKVPFLPFILEGIGGNPEFFQADGIHPNTKGHKKMAEIFVQFAKAQL